jgi:hypothetical protein
MAQTHGSPPTVAEALVTPLAALALEDDFEAIARGGYSGN